MKTRIRWSVLVALLAAALPLARGEEGMWLFNEFPVQQVRERYGFAPSQGWLDHVRLSSVRFNNGGSGSFVSPHGLAMTNHHVGRECIQALSTAEHDYIAHGFYAATPGEELRCPELELNVLVGIEDVTDKVNAGVKPEMSAAQRNQAQKAQMSTLEKSCADSTGLRCDVVTLYEGGMFNLYRYKKYTDVRLVFAPEADIAFFGGDPDNFTYPRYNLDVSFFRAYENGKPAQTEEYLRWSAKGPSEGDLIFVSGNPGSTGRLLTLAQLEFLRDTRYPMALKAINRWRKLLQQLSARGAEEARIAQDDLFTVGNSLKAYTGFAEGLNDSSLMNIKRDAEKELRAAVAANPNWQKQFGGAWDAIAAAEKVYASFYPRYYALERYSPRASRLFMLARHLVRLAEEKTKPNQERLRAYRESALPSLELELYSQAPIYDSLEVVNLTYALGLMQDELGKDDAVVKKVLAGRSPQARAEELVSGTALKDVGVRRKLAAGGLEPIRSSKDPMIVLAREIDPEARAVLKRYEDEVEGVERSQGSLVAKAVFAVRGRTVAPEATFTPRLSYGVVRGYVENGKKIPWFTTFEGLYERATGQFPFRLPKSFIERKSALNLSTPFNFVNTADIIGGNSGSPVVNTRGEVVGLIFDGNIQSLPNNFVYRESVERAVAVHSQAIPECLRTIYHADALLKELTTNR
jgi:hypothetical protein